MKFQNILLILILFFSSRIYSQQGTFTKVFSGNSYEEGIKTFRLPDKSYRIVANTGTYGWGVPNVWIIALDSSAQFKWHKTYSDGGIDLAKDATIDSKGNIYITGITTSNASMSYQMLFLGIDTAGNIFTKKNFGGEKWDFGYGITLINDTTLALVGETYSFGFGQSDAWLLKLNKNGDTIFTKTFGGNKEDIFYGVKTLKNGNFVCVGKSQNYGNGSFNPIVYGISSTGDSIWGNVVLDSSDGTFYNLAIALDSSAIIVGSQNDSTGNNISNRIVKFNKNGVLQWTHFQPQLDKAGYKDVILWQNKIVALGQTVNYGGGGSDIVLAILNNNGDWLNSKTYGNEKDEYPCSVVLDTSNSTPFFLVTGTTGSFNLTHTGALLLRINSVLGCDTSTNILIPSSIRKNAFIESFIKIFPNPFTTQISLVKSKSITDEEFEVSIYNDLGENIYNEVWKRNLETLIINTSSWLPNSYFVIIKNDKCYFSKKIIKAI